MAFSPQINEFRGERSVQLQILDIRPSCTAACHVETGAYRAFLSGKATAAQAAELLPDRPVLGRVWRYIAAAEKLQEMPVCLLRKIVRWSGEPLSLGMLMTCLDIFADVGLLELQRHRKYILVRVLPTRQKADLTQSKTMQRLTAVIDQQ